MLFIVSVWFSYCYVPSFLTFLSWHRCCFTTMEGRFKQRSRDIRTIRHISLSRKPKCVIVSFQEWTDLKRRCTPISLWTAWKRWIFSYLPFFNWKCLSQSGSVLFQAIIYSCLDYLKVFYQEHCAGCQLQLLKVIPAAFWRF